MNEHREMIEISGGGILDGARLLIERPGIWRCAVMDNPGPARSIWDILDPNVVQIGTRVITFRRTGIFTEDEEAIIYREVR